MRGAYDGRFWLPPCTHVYDRLILTDLDRNQCKTYVGLGMGFRIQNLRSRMPMVVEPENRNMTARSESQSTNARSGPSLEPNMATVPGFRCVARRMLGFSHCTLIARLLHAYCTLHCTLHCTLMKTQGNGRNKGCGILKRRKP